jgi:hypothetical protein
VKNKKIKIFLVLYFSEGEKLLPDFTGNSYFGKKICFCKKGRYCEVVTFYVGIDQKTLENWV